MKGNGHVVFPSDRKRIADELARFPSDMSKQSGPTVKPSLCRASPVVPIAFTTS